MAELLLRREDTGLNSGLHTMLKCRELVDVTLVCEGDIIQAHKSVLAACSPHFKRVFMTNPCQHPIVIMQDVRLGHLRALLDFMYTGQAKVKQAEMKRFMKTAEALRVNGLACNDTDLSQDDSMFYNVFDEDETNASENQKRQKPSSSSSQSAPIKEPPFNLETEDVMQIESVISGTDIDEQFEVVGEEQVSISDSHVEAQQAANWLSSHHSNVSSGISFQVIPEPPLTPEPTNKKFKCKHCTKAVFTTEHYLRRHMRNTHAAVSSLSCDFCHEPFKLHSKLEQHVALHHLGRVVDDRYQCTLCDKNYKSKKELIKHQKHKHENVTENVSCHLCHKKFNYYDTLRCHMRKKHNQFNRPRKSK